MWLLATAAWLVLGNGLVASLCEILDKRRAERNRCHDKEFKSNQKKNVKAIGPHEFDNTPALRGPTLRLAGSRIDDFNVCTL